MTRPVTLALRSASVAIVIFLMAFGTILAHAGEPHAEPSADGWSAVGWYGVAAVVVVGATLWLLTRVRIEGAGVGEADREVDGDAGDVRVGRHQRGERLVAAGVQPPVRGPDRHPPA